jgi:hypothetical protein
MAAGEQSAVIFMKKPPALSAAPVLLAIMPQRPMRRPAWSATGFFSKPFRQRDQGKPLLGVVDSEKGQHQP